MRNCNRDRRDGAVLGGASAPSKLAGDRVAELEADPRQGLLVPVLVGAFLYRGATPSGWERPQVRRHLPAVLGIEIGFVGRRIDRAHGAGGRCRGLPRRKSAKEIPVLFAPEPPSPKLPLLKKKNRLLTQTCTTEAPNLKV